MVQTQVSMNIIAELRILFTGNKFIIVDQNKPTNIVDSPEGLIDSISLWLSYISQTPKIKSLSDYLDADDDFIEDNSGTTTIPLIKTKLVFDKSKKTNTLQPSTPEQITPIEQIPPQHQTSEPTQASDPIHVETIDQPTTPEQLTVPEQSIPPEQLTVPEQCNTTKHDNLNQNEPRVIRLKDLIPVKPFRTNHPSSTYTKVNKSLYYREEDTVLIKRTGYTATIWMHIKDIQHFKRNPPQAKELYQQASNTWSIIFVNFLKDAVTKCGDLLPGPFAPVQPTKMPPKPTEVINDSKLFTCNKTASITSPKGTVYFPESLRIPLSRLKLGEFRTFPHNRFSVEGKETIEYHFRNMWIKNTPHG